MLIWMLAVGLAWADAEGDALGRKVAAAAGELSSVSRLQFTFVVEAEGTVKVRRSFDWSPHAGMLDVVGPDGSTISLSGLHGHDLMEAAKDPAASAGVWQAVAPGVEPERAAKAWAWFVNDSYWLLAPTKVMDPGVVRTVDEEGRLVLGFEGVGLTPGDRYHLRLDPETHAVVGWDFVLEGGREGSFDWSEIQDVGPLHLATRKANPEGSFVIRFEGLAADALPSTRAQP
jgi:hypothetical protein